MIVLPAMVIPLTTIIECYIKTCQPVMDLGRFYVLGREEIKCSFISFTSFLLCQTIRVVVFCNILRYHNYFILCA